MSSGDWAAVIVAIAALMVAVVGLPASVHRKPVVVVCVLLVLLAIGIGLVDNLRPVVSLPWRSAEGLVETKIDAGSGEATLFVGRLSDLVKRWTGLADAQVRPDYLASHPDQCVESIVFAGITGHAAVFAEGAPSGLGAAESVPSAAPYGTSQTIHQQILVLPGAAADDYSFRMSAKLQLEGGAAVASDTFSLALEKVDGSRRTWQIDGRGSVECAV